MASRIRKLSKIFRKDTPARVTEASSWEKPVYRGTKPLTIADIHSHTPLQKRSAEDALYDEMEERFSIKVDHDDTAFAKKENTRDNPENLPVNPSPRFIVPENASLVLSREDLLPPLPDKVLVFLVERQRALALEMDLEAPRHPSYTSSYAAMSTRSPGANARLIAGPMTQRRVIHSPCICSTGSESAPSPSPRTDESEQATPYLTPPAERKRLRSVPALPPQANWEFSNDPLASSQIPHSF